MDYEKLGCIHEMFIRQAKATPHATAIVTTYGRKITYGELDDVTDILASNLRVKGVEPDSVVGIHIDKWVLELPIAIISILKAGGAFMRVRNVWSRSAWLMEEVFSECRCNIVITLPEFQEFQDALKILKDITVIELDDNWEKKLKDEHSKLPHGVDLLPPTVHLDNVAFVPYTSGTTGKPKGIMVPHRAAVFSYYWRHENYPYKADDRVACQVYFVWEFLRPLTKGLPVYMFSHDILSNPVRMVEFLYRENITRLLLTPSVLSNILEANDVDGAVDLRSLTKLRLIILNGEVITVNLMTRLLGVLPWVKVSNLYSLSETYDTCSSDLNDDILKKRHFGKYLPVGKPLPGVHIFIMDENCNIQPKGTVGEIYIGTPALARGYINRPEIQKKRLIQRPNTVPESAGDRLFRTGDSGCRLEDGSIEVYGRCDTGIRIRGMTIDLQNTETALAQLPMVASCAVVPCGEEGSDKYIVAYIVPNGPTTREEIHNLLKSKCAGYEQPHYIVFIDSLPTNPDTAKLDKKSLPIFDPNSQPDVKIDYSLYERLVI